MELAKLVLDLSLLQFWAKETNEKVHLLYAQVIEEEDAEDQLEVGIGQKVTQVHTKIRN